MATLKIISCKVSDIEFPLPVLPQPATEDDVKIFIFKSSVLTFSNLIFVEISRAGWQTDWSNFGMI